MSPTNVHVEMTFDDLINEVKKMRKTNASETSGASNVGDSDTEYIHWGIMRLVRMKTLHVKRDGSLL